MQQEKQKEQNGQKEQEDQKEQKKQKINLIILTAICNEIITKAKLFFNKIKQTCKKIPFPFGSKKRFLELILAPCILFILFILIIILAFPSQPKNYAAIPAKSNIKALATAQMMQPQNKPQDTQAINNLQTKLDQIKQELANSNQAQNIQQLENQLSTLTQSVAEIAENLQNTKEVAQKNAEVVQQNYEDTQEHAKQIESQLLVIHHGLTPVKYLSAKALPFKVVGLDFWNGKPMITIAIRDVTGAMQYHLMGEDMSCNNWKLQRLFVDSKTAIFKNAENQKVKVEL